MLHVIEHTERENDVERPDFFRRQIQNVDFHLLYF